MTDLDVRLDIVTAMRDALAETHVEHPEARQCAVAALRTLDAVVEFLREQVRQSSAWGYRH